MYFPHHFWCYLYFIYCKVFEGKRLVYCVHKSQQDHETSGIASQIHHFKSWPKIGSSVTWLIYSFVLQSLFFIHALCNTIMIKNLKREVMWRVIFFQPGIWNVNDICLADKLWRPWPVSWSLEHCTFQKSLWQYFVNYM